MMGVKKMMTFLTGQGWPQRRLPQHISMAVMMKCDQVIYESLNPIPPQQVHYTEPYQYEFGPGADENYGSS